VLDQGEATARVLGTDQEPIPDAIRSPEDLPVIATHHMCAHRSRNYGRRPHRAIPQRWHLRRRDHTYDAGMNGSAKRRAKDRIAHLARQHVDLATFWR